MEFKITIILSHIADQTEDDMFLNAENYIQDDMKDGSLNIENVEDITYYPNSLKTENSEIKELKMHLSAFKYGTIDKDDLINALEQILYDDNKIEKRLIKLI
tara:strand:+ start:665 stop:970 length:306 start_codon:yes stop_codon:yes gene_type:complete